MIRTFGECLTDLMESHGLSASALANRLGVSSAIAIKRLMQDQASEARRNALMARLCENERLFTQRDMAELSQALRVSAVGKSTYIARMSIQGLLFGQDAPRDPYIMLDTGDTLDAYLQKLPAKEPLQLLCMNCCDSAIFSAIYPLFCDPERVLEMNHYVYEQQGSSTMSQFLHAIRPMLFESRYHLHVASQQTNGSDAFFFAPYLLFIKSGVGPRASEKLLLFRADRKVVALMNLQRVTMMDDINRILTGFEPRPVTLGTPVQSTKSPSFRDYLFTCYHQEKNRTVYQLKADPCQEMFPPDVLKAAAVPNVDEVTRKQLMDEIYPIVCGRFQNLMKKAKPTYHVYSYGATIAFFETGILQDHFAWLRPFTVAERIQIADTLLNAAVNNPRYHLHFLKDVYKPGSLQFIGCEGLGVLVCPTTTHYDVMREVCEILVTEPRFCEEYRSYYQNVLLKECVYSQEESVHMLQKIKDRLMAS